MRYWDEFNDKWGFGDGNAVPPDAEVCRTVYLQAINVLLEKHGSSVRVAAFDRPGAHNPYLILYVPKDKFDPEKACSGDHPTEFVLKRDIGRSSIHRTVIEAESMDLDNYVDVVASVSPGFSEFLLRLQTSADPVSTEDCDDE